MLTPGRNRINGTLRLSATFRNSSDVLTDPSVLTAKTYAPSGLIETYTYPTSTGLGKASTGLYYLDVAPNEAGRWHVRWTATISTATLILEDDFIVQTSPFVEPSYDWRGDYQ